MTSYCSCLLRASSPAWALISALLVLVTSPVHATSPGLPLTKDFSNTDLRDGALTSADWSTEDQAVLLAWSERRQLPRYSATGTDVGSEADRSWRVMLGDVDGDGRPFSIQTDPVGVTATVESETSAALPEWIVEFVYTGAPATWIVPPSTVDVVVDLRGALGGWSNSGPDDPGSPGRARATLTASPGTAWQINVGGKGSVGTGGFNGGGDSILSIGFIGGGGGGATDLRIGGTSLAERRLVAGGGGGAGDNQFGRGGGHGGGLEGTDGLAHEWSPDSYGRGGTQLAGGAGGTSNFDGQPGVAGDGGDGVQGGGGGGGWYGGGGGGGYSPVNYTSGGGGGGSGYGPPGAVLETGVQGDPPAGIHFADGYGRLTFRATHAAGLAVTVTGSQIYGGEPTYSVTYEGFLEGDDATAVTGTVSCSTDATATSAVGDGYTVTDCSGLSSVDYALFYVDGGLTVTATTPGAPMIGAATGGNASASISFTAPTNDGGSAITGYTATCGAQSTSGATSPITVTGLTNGTPVTCTVLATNAVGNSAPSAASNTVTPQAASQTNLSAPASSVFGEAVTLVASVTGESPTGSVAFSDGGNAIAGCTAVALTAGSAQCNISALAVGSRQLTADYAGDAANLPSTGQSSHQVYPASTAISVSGPPRTRINTSTAFDFALAVAVPGGGTPTGTVTLTGGSNSCQVSVPAAMSSCELSFDLLGPRTVSASFVSTDGNHLVSGSSGAGDLQTLVFAQSDLEVTKTDTVDSYREGDLLVYTITLGNLGEDVAANLRLRDTVPAGLVDVQWSCVASGGAVCPATSGVGDIDVQIASYSVGSLLSYSFSGNVSGQPEQILNTATVELPADGTIEDSYLANNSASDLNHRNLLFADGFEAATVTAAKGIYRLPSATLLPLLDGTATVVFELDDAQGQAARIYARVFNGQLQYALAQRASDGLLSLGPWVSYSGEPLLSWNASEEARGWVVAVVGLE